MTRDHRELRDSIAAEAEHAEVTMDADLAYRRRSSGPHLVYGLRLPAERIAQLRELAEARGVEPSVLARGWVLDHLDSAQREGDADRDRWEREVRATTDRLRQLLDERPGA